jgi:hypothetical protein
MLPPPNFTNIFSIVLLNVTTAAAASFSLDAVVSCQWYRRPSQAVFSVQMYGRPGVNRLFSTGLFSYDSVLCQIHVSGEIAPITSLDVRYVLGDLDFCRESVLVRWVLAAFAVVCFVSYAISLVAFSQGFRVEQLLSLISVLICALANCPIEFTNPYQRSIVVHCLNAFFRGVFGSFNTVCLFLFVFLLNGGEVLGFAILMSLLYVLGNSIQTVTNDTRILKLFFDGNMDVWMFFVSVSLMGRIGLFTLQVYHALVAYYCSRAGRRQLTVVYSGMIALEIGVAVLQGTVYYVNGYGNFALDFFADYLLQTFFAFVFVDVHWPQVQTIRKVPLIDQHMGIEDVHFAAAFGETPMGF